MKVNESIAISTSKVLLVPYDRRHVLKYHAWMEDPAIQEATASERLTLEEEYENQESWRASHDKLTFIICQPLSLKNPPADVAATDVTAGEVDTSGRMVGDVNFFLYPSSSSDDEGSAEPALCVGEVDIMIADPKDRGKGVGRAVIQAFLHYILRNLNGILDEYRHSHEDSRFRSQPPRLAMLMAKIKAGNSQSIALFRSLGFAQEGEVNYFGEVKLVLRDFSALPASAPEGYAELVYTRPDDKLLNV